MGDRLSGGRKKPPPPGRQTAGRGFLRSRRGCRPAYRRTSRFNLRRNTSWVASFRLVSGPLPT